MPAIQEEWNKSLADRTSLSVLLIDVDDFKQYNDIHGHLVGDEVLRQVAETLHGKSSGSNGCLARFGGEEFGAILPSTNVAGAQRLGEVYRRSVEELKFPRKGAGVDGFLTVSVGGATTIPGLLNLANCLCEGGAGAGFGTLEKLHPGISGIGEGRARGEEVFGSRNSISLSGDCPSFSGASPWGGIWSLLPARPATRRTQRTCIRFIPVFSTEGVALSDARKAMSLCAACGSFAPFITAAANTWTN
jgi:diguanylate cyclase (GGDEF)-like protein